MLSADQVLPLVLASELSDRWSVVNVTRRGGLRTEYDNKFEQENAIMRKYEGMEGILWKKNRMK